MSKQGLECETVGQLKRLLELWKDEMQVEPVLRFEYVAPDDNGMAAFFRVHLVTQQGAGDGSEG